MEKILNNKELCSPSYISYGRVLCVCKLHGLYILLRAFLTKFKPFQAIFGPFLEPKFIVLYRFIYQIVSFFYRPSLFIKPFLSSLDKKFQCLFNTIKPIYWLPQDPDKHPKSWISKNQKFQLLVYYSVNWKHKKELNVYYKIIK